VLRSRSRIILVELKPDAMLLRTGGSGGSGSKPNVQHWWIIQNVINYKSLLLFSFNILPILI
jgi:hypothetical protein